MVELASRDQLGATIGDTFGDDVVKRVYRDGVYLFVNRQDANREHTLESLTDSADAQFGDEGIMSGDVWLAAHRQEATHEKYLFDMANNGVLSRALADGTPCAGFKKPNASKVGVALTIRTMPDTSWQLDWPSYYYNLGDTADTITPGAGIQLHQNGNPVGSITVEPWSSVGLVKTADGIVEQIIFGAVDTSSGALTASINPASLNAGATEEYEVPFAGAVVGDAFVPASPIDVGSPANGFFQATCNYSRDDFVRIVLRNNDVKAHDLPNAVWRIYKVNSRDAAAAASSGVQALVAGAGVTIGGTASNPQISFTGSSVQERTFAQISAQADTINQPALKTRPVVVYISDRDVYVRPGSSLAPTGPWSEAGSSVVYVTPA